MKLTAKFATITATREVVTIVSVSGGWTTIASNGTTRKIRNGALSDHRDAPIKVASANETNAKNWGLTKTDDKPASTERKNGRVDPLYLQFYGKYSATRSDGATVKSLDNGDLTAQLLRAYTLDETYAYVAIATGVSADSLKARYRHLNPGMQRMNLGNVLRKARREYADKIAA
jgi:hypothetical protein